MIVKSLTKTLGTVAAVTLFASMPTAGLRADPGTFIFHGVFGSNVLDASAIFVANGDNLTITLTNTSTLDVTDPAQILTALFFDATGTSVTNPTLIPVSATLGSGSTVFFDTQPAGGVVGGEWEYRVNGSGPVTPSGGNVAKQAISSAGLGLGGSQTMFPGPDLDGNANVDGVGYGITAAGDNPATGNAAVTGSNPLIHNQVVFVLSGLTAAGITDPSTQITNVWFQYGTALSDGGGGFLPEPAFYQMAGFLSLGGLGLLKLRRRRKA